MQTQTIPATRSQITSWVSRARRSKQYYKRVPADSQIRGKRFTDWRIDREFPADDALLHQVRIEAQSPLFTSYYDEGETPDQCKLVFSSPGLTAWYVQQFCKMNHLK